MLDCKPLSWKLLDLNIADKLEAIEVNQGDVCILPLFDYQPTYCPR